jgi:hypothetical protein
MYRTNVIVFVRQAYKFNTFCTATRSEQDSLELVRNAGCTTKYTFKSYKIEFSDFVFNVIQCLHHLWGDGVGTQPRRWHWERQEGGMFEPGPHHSVDGIENHVTCEEGSASEGVFNMVEINFDHSVRPACTVDRAESNFPPASPGL